MEILNISNPTTFPVLSFCHPKTLSSKFPPNHTKPTSSFRRTSFSLCLSRSAATKFQTWAHSGRPTNRRNSLRKKLLRDHKVNPNQIPNEPFPVSGNGVDESGVGVQGVSDVDNVGEVEKSKSKLLGESVLWNKLESWVDQYKKDIEYWGVGSGPIFTVYEDSLSCVKRVLVDEDQILKRSKVGRDVIEDLPEVRSKILNAKNMAREMESGNNVIGRNSSVAKFVVQGKEEGGFVKAIQGFVAKPRLLPRLSGIGRKVLYGLIVVWVVKKLFVFGEGGKEVEYTPTEKEMMRRKIKARKEKEKLGKGAVEVVLEPSETPVVEIKKPKLDKEQLRNSILNVKGSSIKLLVHDSSDKVKARSKEMEYKVQEIREMARQARKIEGRDNDVVMDNSGFEKSSNDNEKNNSQQDDGLSNHQNEAAKETAYSNAIMHSTSVDVPKKIDDSVLHQEVPADKGNLYALDVLILGDSEIRNGNENVKPSDSSINGSSMTNESYVKKKPRIIRSVKKARDYLSKKHDKQDPGTGTESKIELVKENIAESSSVIDFNGQNQKYQSLENNTIVSKSGTLSGILNSKPLINASEDSNQKYKELSSRKNEYIKDSGIEPGLQELQKYETTLDHEVGGISKETRLLVKPENWLEKKLQKVEPIIEQTRSDALNGLSDFKLASNPSEDSNQKDKEFSSTKDDYFKDSGIEPDLGDLQKSDKTLDHEISGIRMETNLPVKPENWPDKNLLEVEHSRSGALNGLPDSKPATNPSENSDQKNKEFDATKDDYLKDVGVEPGLRNHQKSDTTFDHEINGIAMETRLPVKPENLPNRKLLEVEQIRSHALSGLSDSKHATNPSEDSDQNNNQFGSTKDDYLEDSHVQSGKTNHQKSDTTLDGEVNNGISTETTVSIKTENWMEKNFHEVEPIVKQIRAGFRNNYMAAKEKVNQPSDIPTEMESLGGVEDGGELGWMQDDHLRDIVFRVRENELSGRDPFYLMNDEDKDTFFTGLEKKVESENKKLSHIHEWLHSNIENLDYGADGISIYDLPEKFIPRWKGPPVEKIPEFLNKFLDDRKAGSTTNMNPMKKDESGFALTSADSSLQGKADGSKAPIKKLKIPKTIIEGSDGSIKIGRKSGKEYWQHTKKWSQGFLDCYNDEADPEIKSVMKDMGKDLDRWITEKEIEEAAELMDKLPDRNRSFMEKKLSKIKREMELFGPQAVVSKYREYADDKEEDYLWWLDLSHILCIELYTVEEEEQKIGLYSLEMATDLELEPKPYHVIAFQDPGDCKNLCYIIQAHMEMLGNGHAFVVARPPKDAFREAKANGFGVTVIKKGELQLNIDQPLEEVEEQITEIGSKMYHDMMMKERSVDINTLMKGVFGFSDRTIKRLKRKLKSRKG